MKSLKWAFCLFCLSTQALSAQWPDWLGQSVLKNTEKEWQIHVENDEVIFSPIQVMPSIWVLISRKATSYDVALETVLNDFAKQLPNANFKVFLLPHTDTDLKVWIQKAEQNASLILTLGSEAASRLHQVYEGGQLPVVTVNAKDPVLLGLADDYHSSESNFAFTSLNLPAEIILIFLRYFMPQLKQIGVLYGAENTSAYLSQYLPLEATAKAENIQVYPIAIGEKESQSLKVVMPQKIAEMKKIDPTLEQSLLWITGSSSLFDQMASINALSQKMPILSAVPDIVDESDTSALMSIGVSFENNARLAAYYAIQILKHGKVPKDLPIGLMSPPDISINMNKAKQNQIKVPFMLIEMANEIYVDSNDSTHKSQPMMEVKHD